MDAPFEEPATASELRLGELLEILRSGPRRSTAALTPLEQDAVVLHAIRRQSAITGYATGYLVNLLLQAEAEDTRPIIDRLVASGRVSRGSLGHWAGPDDAALRIRDGKPVF